MKKKVSVKEKVENVNGEAIGHIKELFGHLVDQVNLIRGYETSLKKASTEAKKNLYKDLLVNQIDDLTSKVKILEDDINGLKDGKDVNGEAIGHIKELFGHLVDQVILIRGYEASSKKASTEAKKNLYKDLIVNQLDDLTIKVKLLEDDINGLKE